MQPRALHKSFVRTSLSLPSTLEKVTFSWTRCLEKCRDSMQKLWVEWGSTQVNQTYWVIVRYGKTWVKQTRYFETFWRLHLDMVKDLDIAILHVLTIQDLGQCRSIFVTNTDLKSTFQEMRQIEYKWKISIYHDTWFKSVFVNSSE